MVSAMEKQLIPAGYKQTEVGVIPEDWEMVFLGDYSIISRLAGAEYTSVWKEDPAGEIIALRGFNIGKNRIIERDLTRISNSLSMQLKRSRLTRGDVVYPCVGSIGNAVVITDDDKYHIQQNIARISPDKGKLNSEYLAHFLMSEIAFREVERSTATTSQPSVLVSSLREYRIPLPTSLQEQTAIANALSDIDALIVALEKLINKKSAIKTAAMQQLLTGKKRLPPFDQLNTGYKQTELGEIPGDWEVKSLANICSMKSGASITSAGINDSGKYPCYGGNGLRGYTKSFTHDGDFALIGRQGALCGNIVSVKGQFFASEHAIVVTPHQKTNIDWLAYILYRMNLNQYSESSAQPGLSVSKLLVFRAICPSQEEQTAIANVLSDMDKDLEALQQRLNKTQQIKQGMMQELLTGKTRLV
jgi:type I restriction enzyme S subunit